MKEIISLTNEIVKETAKLQQKKYRKETGLFLIEGCKALEEAIEYGIELVRVFAKNPDTARRLPPNIEVIKTSEAVLKKIAAAESAPPAAAVARQKKQKKEDIISAKNLILLEGIKDAGNLGTILRAASAFDIGGIILFGDTVDIYNPKCVRASTGNLWKNNIFEISDFGELKLILNGFIKIGTSPQASSAIPLKDFTFPEKYCVMFGAEAGGLSAQLKTFADKNITIEMNNNVESLNLALSAGIIMYEMRKIYD